MKKSPKKSETRGRKKKPDKLVPVMTHLPPEVVELLNLVAKWEDRPVSQVVRRATGRYLAEAMRWVSDRSGKQPISERAEGWIKETRAIAEEDLARDRAIWAARGWIPPEGK